MLHLEVRLITEVGWLGVTVRLCAASKSHTPALLTACTARICSPLTDPASVASAPVGCMRRASTRERSWARPASGAGWTGGRRISSCPSDPQSLVLLSQTRRRGMWGVRWAGRRPVAGPWGRGWRGGWVWGRWSNSHLKSSNEMLVWTSEIIFLCCEYVYTRSRVGVHKSNGLSLIL